MKATAAVLIGLATFSVCELAVALFGIALPQEQVRLFSEFYIRDSELGFKLAPNLSNYEVTWLNGKLRQRYSTDHLGFRNVDRDYSTARYFVIGDSFAFGDWVEREKTFYGLLENYTGCPVMTLGVSGYELVQYLVLLEKYVPENDVEKKVMLFIFANDLDQAKSKADMRHYYEEAGFPLYDDHAPWSTRLSIYRTLTFKLYVGLRESRQYAIREADNGVLLFRHRGANPNYLRNQYYVGIEKQLSELLGDVESRADVELVVFLVPSKESTYKAQYRRLVGGSYLSNEEQGYERIEQLLRRRNVQVHNMTSLFRAESKRILYFREDPHWNAGGHALMAEALYASMAEAN